MKDKKFTVLCVLGAAWLIVFIGMMFGMKINPKVEQLITFLCVGWFAFWTLSSFRSWKKVGAKETTIPINNNPPNKNATKESKNKGAR